LSVEKPLIKDQEGTIFMNCSLRDSSWEDPSYHEIDIDTDNKLIKIELWTIVHIGGGHLPYYRYYLYKTSIIFPSSGNWTINANGYSIEVFVF
jgi:hypothetical protein